MTKNTTYLALAQAGNKLKERNDCAVIAVSLVTGLPYQEAWYLLKKFGRRYRTGTNFKNTTRPALEAAGFTVTNVSDYRFKHPLLSAKTVRTLGDKIGPFKTKNFLIRTGGRTTAHILAAVGGEIIDWSLGRCSRIREIWEVAK